MKKDEGLRVNFTAYGKRGEIEVVVTTTLWLDAKEQEDVALRGLEVVVKEVLEKALSGPGSMAVEKIVVRNTLALHAPRYREEAACILK
jgi:hypothetical protein